jgi:aspartate ammonia-lyase
MSAGDDVYRNETDSLGEVSVPSAAYFGAQTMRAVENFPISRTFVSSMPDIIQALAMVKKAAALSNERLGLLSAEKAMVIATVCDEIIAGRHDDQFPIDVFQGGAGTSTNMNMNEVIANRGLEILGMPRGNYSRLHPNDDVNLSQSTNDVYPTAIRLALLIATPKLARAMGDLASAFQAKGEEFSQILKLGRTQLQDAVPMTLGQEFAAFGTTIREDLQRLEEARLLLCEVNLGGTAIGTGITTVSDYQGMVVSELARVSGIRLASSENLVEACWDTGAFVHFSGVLKRIAVKLSKISNDLRLLSSGPRGGVGEILLPAVQPGSSIMPGKMNPVIPEVVNQVAFYVIGQDMTVTFAAEAGQLQLNAFEPVIAFSLLQSIKLLANAIATLERRCVVGIRADEAVCARNLMSGTALVTALVPVIGYERAAVMAKAILSGQSLQSLLDQTTDLGPLTVTELLNAEVMTRPSRPRQRS